MLILVEPVGNHSNRLFQHIHIDSFCKQKNVFFYNPTFFDMAKDYKLKKTYNTSLAKLIYLAIKFFIKFKVIKPVQFSSEIKLKRITFIKDSGFRCDDSILIDKPFYKDLFSLLKEVDANVLNNFNNDKIKIGVHFRRGDYRTWNDGIYYYSDEQFINIIQQVISHVNKDVYLYFFSNEKLDEEKFKLKFGNNIYFSNNEYYVDHYLMSKCDYLVGPPSTFTSFASFIGETKFYHINDVNKNVSLIDFKVSNG